MSITPMNELNLQNKVVLIREDLNVPIEGGRIVSDARLQASLPTIKMALEQGAGVMVCSHLGRPTEGEASAEFSLQPVADYLSEALGQPVKLITDYLDDPEAIKGSVSAGDVVLLENVRFNTGEKKNSEALSTKYAGLADVFIMDAFGTAHRAQASTEGVIRAMQRAGKPVGAGLLLAGELDALDTALKHPAKPMVAIVGGSKVSTKLDVLNSLADICDHIIVGGGIANTFLLADGHNVGASLCEADMVDTARAIMQKTHIVLPSEVVVASKDSVDFSDFIGSLGSASATSRAIDAVQDNEMILDVSPAGMQEILDVVANAKTILWNGPLGVFEVDAFAEGTQKLADAIAQSDAFSMAGGGDTLAAIHKFGVADDVSYLSTGGGAFLEFVEGKTLPAVKALEDAKK